MNNYAMLAVAAEARSPEQVRINSQGELRDGCASAQKRTPLRSHVRGRADKSGKQFRIEIRCNDRSGGTLGSSPACSLWQELL
jgi:hypothetical protein